MQLHPTQSAVDVNIAGLLVLGLGVVLGKAVLVAWGGSLIVGLQIARAVTLYSVSRVRGAGFEMLWSEDRRLVRGAVAERIKLEAEVRNRDDRAARFVELRALHSPMLDVELAPRFGEVPAGGRLLVSVFVTPTRVGRHAIHGLSLEVRGSPGLYEVPLTFSNPCGIEALPAAYARLARPARGGRSRMHTEEGRAGRHGGGNQQLREIREYAHGDAFKRIAWKATARRGQLMTREYDLEEKDVVWVVLDASVELWSGVIGESPLDCAVERAATLIEQHLQNGDRVGLVIVGHRVLAQQRPGRGPAEGAKMMELLAFATGLHDADRSGLSEQDVASRVLEHLRPLDSRLTAGVRSSQLDRVAQRAAAMLERAPFAAPPPTASSEREQALRHYLSCFGVTVPGRLEPDRGRTDLQLALVLKRLVSERPKPSLLYVVAPPPAPDNTVLLDSLRALPARRAEIRWVTMPLDAGLPEAVSSRARAVEQAICWRAEAVRHQGERQLQAARIKVEPPRYSRQPPSAHRAAGPLT